MNLFRSYDRVKVTIDGLLLSEGLRAKTRLRRCVAGRRKRRRAGVRFARNMVLARVLAPEAFGTMAIVISSASLVDTLTDVGVKER